MRRISRLSILLIALAAVLVFSINVKADVAEPGSEADPVVTKSYVDKVLADLKQYVDSKSGNSASLEIVYMEKRQHILGDKGTEMILRSGIATAVDSGNGGLADVTQGKDIVNGENISQNHLLIVPREDGRGMKAENDNVVVLVRGNYTLEQ